MALMSDVRQSSRWVAALGATMCLLASADAEESGAPRNGSTESIVITGSRSTAADRAIVRRVEAALAADPYLDASRVTVTATDGVVNLEGIVYDSFDLLRVIRIGSRVAGAKRVVEDLDVPDFDNGP